MKNALLLCALGAALLGSQVAKADSFDLSFSDSTSSLTGAVTFDAPALGGAITNAGGDVFINGYDFSVTGTSGYSGADNILDFNSGSGAYSFDQKGASFLIADNPFYGAVNIYINRNGTDKGQYVVTFEGIVPVDGDTVTLTSESITNTSVAATPEPGSLALLGTSILGGAGILRRRFSA